MNLSRWDVFEKLVSLLTLQKFDKVPISLEVHEQANINHQVVVRRGRK